MDKIQTIEKLFFYINSFSYLILPLACLFFWTNKRDLFIIGFYGLLFFFPVFFGEDTPVRFRKLFLFSYTFLEYCFFSTLLFFNIESKKYKKIILVFSLLFLFFQIFYYYQAKVGRLDSIPVGIETVLLFIFIFFFFYEQFKTQKSGDIYSNHGFWISVAILLYLGGSFFFNILANHIDKKQIDDYWYLTYIGETVKNIFFVIALFLYSRRSYGSKQKTEKTIPYLDMV